MLRPVDDRRFWAKVERTDDHWWWRGEVSDFGYGRVGRTLGRDLRLGTRAAHRAAWILAGKDLRPGQVLHHLCSEKLCVRPAHLWCMSKAEHTRHHWDVEGRPDESV